MGAGHRGCLGSLTRQKGNQVQESLFHEQNYFCEERRGRMGPFLSGHDPRLVREGGWGWGKSAFQGEETPGPAGGSRRGNDAGVAVGTRTTCPKLFQPITTPPPRPGRDGAGTGWSQQCVSEAADVCKSARRRGAEPLPPPHRPLPKQAAEAGGGAAAVLLYPSCMAVGGRQGQEEEG